MGKKKSEKTLSLSFSYDNFEIDNFKVTSLVIGIALQVKLTSLKLPYQKVRTIIMFSKEA